jgi:hypothetical protein
LAAPHSADLHEANQADDRIWDYLPYGPFASQKTYGDWVGNMAQQDDPWFLEIRDLESGRCGRGADYLRITRAATEAIHSIMKLVIEARYRRFEWKCDAGNLGSRRAAERFGFSYEGIFRQATIVKGRNRDTAWFAIFDKESPKLDKIFQAWLVSEDFDENGKQRHSFSAMTAPFLVARDQGPQEIVQSGQ